MLEFITEIDQLLSNWYRKPLLSIHFFFHVQKCTWKARNSLLSRKINKASTPGVSQLSSQSSPRGQTPHGSETSTGLCSEDNVKINVASSDVMSESAQAKEQPPLFPCKFLSLTTNIKWICFQCYQGEPMSNTLLDVPVYFSSGIWNFVPVCTLPISKLV